MSTIEYRPGRIKDIIKLLADFTGQKYDYLSAVAYNNIPELKNKKACPNCDASMAEYVYTLDLSQAILLSMMGRIVRESLEDGVEFSEANQVRVVRENMPDYVRHATSIAKYLGLVAKVPKRDKEGKIVTRVVQTEDGDKKVQVHDIRKGWLITKRGFSALRGEQVPALVKVWRGQIIERTDIVTTLVEVFENHRREVEANKKVNNHTHDFAEYDPKKYYDIEKYHQGRIL